MSRIYLADHEIKSELISILKECDRYFRAHDLKYTIFAGTLIGAKRHSGFIPWDDDIDVALLRPEYDRLVTLLRKDRNISDHLLAEGFELGNGDIPFLKIVNTDIFSEEKVSDKSTETDHLWVDVFPIDGVPSFGGRFFFRYLSGAIRAYEWKRIRVHGWQMESDTTDAARSFKNRIYEAFVDRFSLNTLTRRMIRIGRLFDVNRCKFAANTLWGFGFEKETFPVELMDEMEEIPFEGIRVMAMKRAHEWLTIRYGDYMKLPPESERINHGLKAWREDGEE